MYTVAFAPKVGGVETAVRFLAEQLATKATPEWDLVVVARTPGGEFPDHTLPFPVVRTPSMRRLWQLIGQADLIHLDGPTLLPLIMALVQRKRVVVRHHGYQAACPTGLLLYEPTKTPCPGHFMARRYHRCLACNLAVGGPVASVRSLLLTFPRRLACKLVRTNIHNSNYVRRVLQLPRSRVVYYGVRWSGGEGMERPRSAVAANVQTPPPDGAENARPTFAYVGRLVSEKGLAILLEATHKLKARGIKCQVKLIGDGPERERLEQLTAAYGLDDHVTFVGFKTGDDFARELRDVQAVIMPSVWPETGGLAAVEQMMAGRLVIVSDTGGMSEYVGPAGLKCPAFDAEALARCMQLAVEDPALVARLVAEARERAMTHFAPDVTLRDNLDVFRHAVYS